MKQSNLLGIIIAGLIGFILYLAFHNTGSWTGIYKAPSLSGSPSNWEVKYGMESLEECSKWGEKLRVSNNNSDLIYYCGKNCKEDSGNLNCEERYAPVVESSIKRVILNQLDK